MHHSDVFPSLSLSLQIKGQLLWRQVSSFLDEGLMEACISKYECRASSSSVGRPFLYGNGDCLLRIDVQLTKDLVLVLFHDYSLGESDTDVLVHEVTLD